MANLYPFIAEMKTMLLNLDRWLVMGAEHAKAKKTEPDALTVARLALDQYPLVRQVQSACDSAKLAAARMTGKEAPKHADDEKTFDEMRARIVKATTFLDSLSEKDFEGADTRKVPLPFLPGGNKGALGADYLVHWAQPNFYFHLIHAYAILRHNGVNLGKMDFVGPMPPVLDM
ncbi:MAG: hypothetical protein JWO86_6808 [Myxococcaceae bacterium]|nr:hypothetical protein [Myxococcaceae bacterium]MEA2746536.1 uncharacterized protein [Myxococcales bacterium]